jgi:hypothetical protein
VNLSATDEARLVVALKAVPSLCAVVLDQFRIEAGLELLRSRPNWSRIELPSDAEARRKASVLAARNQTSFELILHSSIDVGLKSWLAKPHVPIGVRVSPAAVSMRCGNARTLLIWSVCLAPLSLAFPCFFPEPCFLCKGPRYGV